MVGSPSPAGARVLENRSKSHRVAGQFLLRPAPVAAARLLGGSGGGKRHNAAIRIVRMQAGLGTEWMFNLNASLKKALKSFLTMR
ncbi:MAG TPA: hypothetical protein VGC27_07120 [Rhizomicrobium sp.]